MLPASFFETCAAVVTAVRRTKDDRDREHFSEEREHFGARSYHKYLKFPAQRSFGGNILFIGATQRLKDGVRKRPQRLTE